MLGVVTGLVIGTGELAGFVEGIVMGGVEPGLAGVIVTGLVAGMVIMGGVGLSGGLMSGVVGKIVVGGLIESCRIALRWDLLRSSLWEEGKICSSSLLSSFCTKSSMDDTSAYNPTICPVI